MLNTKRASCLSLIIPLLVLTGCGAGTAAKMAYHELRGAQGSLMFIQEPGSSEFARYNSVSFNPATTTIGSTLCPPDLRTTYDQCAREQVENLVEYYPGGSPALTISADILYFQSKGIMSGAECLTRVRFNDSGRQVADAIVRVESKAFRTGGSAAMAEATVKTIGKYLKEHKEPAEDEDRHEDDD
ncbi:MAG: hypothetical protein ABIG44_03305 [Planctomycetota bacterium]